MITSIRERTTVKNGGRVEVYASGLDDGTEVEVLIFLAGEMDETEYLLSTEANRERLLKAARNLDDKERRISIDLDEYEKTFPWILMFSKTLTIGCEQTGKLLCEFLSCCGTFSAIHSRVSANLSRYATI